MADLTRWNPFDEFVRLRDDFGRMMGSNFFEKGYAWSPVVDIRETDTHLIVSAEIPGVNPDDLDMVVSEDSITISGETKQESRSEERGIHRTERRFGSFRRTIPFPMAVKHEQATADYKNGVLEVTVPKAEPDRQKSTHVKVRSKNLQ